MDQDGSLNISFNEWRDFLLLAPSDNIHDIIKYWRHSTVSENKFLLTAIFLSHTRLDGDVIKNFHSPQTGNSQRFLSHYLRSIENSSELAMTLHL